MNPTLHLVSFDAFGQLSMVACGQLAVCGQLLRGLFGVLLTLILTLALTFDAPKGGADLPSQFLLIM